MGLPHIPACPVSNEEVQVKHSWNTQWCLGLGIALGVLLAPGVTAGAAASEAPTPDEPARVIGPFQDSLARAVAAVASERVETAARSQTDAADTSEPRTFFRSRRGQAALALTAAGVAFTIYSMSNDRISSPIR
jgi:hypothetical protein